MMQVDLFQIIWPIFMGSVIALGGYLFVRSDDREAAAEVARKAREGH